MRVSIVFNPSGVALSGIKYSSLDTLDRSIDFQIPT